jgi:hypothetical protein
MICSKEVEMNEVTRWLLESDEPWTRYRTMTDLLDRHEDDPEVQAARSEMVNHPLVRSLIDDAASWPGYALKRHNDAKHPIHTLAVLADFGLRTDDPGMSAVTDVVMEHQSAEGPFQTLVRLYKRFGGMDGEYWTWIACDAPVIAYALSSCGLVEDPRVRRALDHLAGLVEENGWRCRCSPQLGSFHGPGKETDPCPIANVYALKALSTVPDLADSPAAHAGAEMLLWHWGPDCDRKIYLFGAGTFFRRLKYPFVWYDVLHVADVLSRFPFVHDDPRFQNMLETITDQADKNGRYTAASMYRAWKGWSFADKKSPSPWLTFLVRRILRRTDGHGGMQRSRRDMPQELGESALSL